MRLFVVTPSFLDTASFLELRRRILEQVTGFDPLLFVVIDDTGGADAEVKQLSALTDTRVLTPPFNLGHQRALVFGLRSLASELRDDDYVITLDSDGEDRPEDIPRLLAPLREHPDDTRLACLAWRTKRRETPLFKAMYAVFKLVFGLLTGVSIRTGNFAAYRGWLAKHVLFHPHFDNCYSSSLISLNVKVQQVPCERGTRYAGQSRMSFLKLVTHGLRMMMPFTDRIAVRALIGFLVGFASSAAAVLALVVLPRLGLGPFPDWAMYLSVLTLVLSAMSLGNFVVLFTVFSHAQGQSFRGLEQRSP
ncbi:MAG: glycosyltransferase [Archangiaceae bacterium]|nr:glycosyltransferase [Archangiaceae bacterium]